MSATLLPPPTPQDPPRAGRSVAGVDGFPDADLYQILAYYTAVKLADGHLVDAKGNTTEITHQVRHTDITIHAHTLDLDTPPADLLSQVERLARQIVTTAAATRGAGRVRTC
jgi:5-methylcytosine-specific restriction enzyme subunit McrC